MSIFNVISAPFKSPRWALVAWILCVTPMAEGQPTKSSQKNRTPNNQLPQNSASSHAQPSAAEHIKLLLTQMEQIERPLNLLNEQLQHTNLELNDLKTSLLTNQLIANGRIRMQLNNTLNPSIFRFEQAQILLNGVRIFKQINSDDADKSPTIDIYQAEIQAGTHRIDVLLDYRGKGSGSFSYLAAYKFHVESSKELTVNEGDIVRVSITSYEKSGPNLNLTDKPAIKIEAIQEAIR